MRLNSPVLARPSSIFPVVRALLIVGMLATLAAPVMAASDAEEEAVDALLKSDAKGGRAAPDAAALDGLFADTDRDIWLVIEYLLVRNRQDVAQRVAQLADESRIGPIRAYAAALVARPPGADRAVEYRAALAAQAAGDAGAALTHVKRVRGASGRGSVFGARAAALESDLLAAAGHRVESIEARLVGAEEALSIGWWNGAETYFGQASAAALLVRNLDLLMRATEGGRALVELRGEELYLAASEQNLGVISEARGDHSGALRHFDEAVALYEAMGSGDDTIGARSLRSSVLAEVGDFRAAIEEQRALALHFADRTHDAAWAENQVHLGLVRCWLGDEPGASGAFARAIEAFHALGERDGEANARGNLGIAHRLAGRWTDAIDAYRAAQAVLEATGDPIGVATCKQNVAESLKCRAEIEWAAVARTSDASAREGMLARGHAALIAARTLLEEALSASDVAGAAGLSCSVRLTLAQTLLAEGRWEEAVKALEPARDEAVRLRSWKQDVEATISLARARLALEDWPGAVREARRASGQLADVFGTLADTDLARAQSMMPDAYDLGIRGALRVRSVDDLLYFIEAGRAAALLRGLGGRAAALRATVPPAVEARLAAASRAKVLAYSTWQKSRTEELPVERALWKAYDARRVEEQNVRDELAQVQLAAAGRLAPSRLVSIGDLRTRLRATARPGLKQVFTLFNFQDSTGVALLVEEAGPRYVVYPPEDLVQLRGAFETLAASRDGELDVDALGVVKRLLIDPLKLPAGPTRLFVSPDRELAYVPLCAILPDDCEIVWEPSATTFDLLTERRIRRGAAMLGLGDPDYQAVSDPDVLATRGGPRLVRLPGTRAEIAVIAADTGDRTLLGAGATESGLAKALDAVGPEHRWKSVHLACHGLVDVERPTLSCLALTPGDGEDGFLTASEVLSLALRTDLAVLSACQTGRGKFVRSEGVMSLARAFMHAGAARVIASQWNVDDDATGYLMKEFYREWAAGRGTAQALRLAQIAVRDHEIARTSQTPGKPATTTTQQPWSNPKYWAAWQLWGLAD